MKLIEICNPSSLHAQNTNPVSGTAGQGSIFYILYYFKLYLSFIDPERGGFGVIFPEGLCPEENIITEGNITSNPPIYK
jgi:hypothetical protein